MMLIEDGTHYECQNPKCRDYRFSLSNFHAIKIINNIEKSNGVLKKRKLMLKKNYG